jgi:hypothetical protein
MQVGFVSQILWSRYGAFWQALSVEAGAETRFASPEAVLRQQRTPALRAVPSTPFRLATAEALALHDCDLIIVPHPNAGHSSTRGGGQDPWISDFPTVLSATTGLLHDLGVPTDLSAAVEPLAVELLQRLTNDGGRVRRLWDRHRASLQPAALPQPPVTRAGTVAVLAQPWLLNDELIRLAAGDAELVISQRQLEPAQLRAEGERLISGLLPTDSEVLGAAHWFARRGGVDRLVLIVDAGSGVDTWLASQITRLVHKPVQVIAAQELLPGDSLVASLLESGPQAARG